MEVYAINRILQTVKRNTINNPNKTTKLLSSVLKSIVLKPLKVYPIANNEKTPTKLLTTIDNNAMKSLLNKFSLDFTGRVCIK